MPSFIAESPVDSQSLEAGARSNPLVASIESGRLSEDYTTKKRRARRWKSMIYPIALSAVPLKFIDI